MPLSNGANWRASQANRIISQTTWNLNGGFINQPQAAGRQRGTRAVYTVRIIWKMLGHLVHLLQLQNWPKLQTCRQLRLKLSWYLIGNCWQVNLQHTWPDQDQDQDECPGPAIAGRLWFAFCISFRLCNQSSAWVRSKCGGQVLLLHCESTCFELRPDCTAFSSLWHTPI